MALLAGQLGDEVADVAPLNTVAQLMHVEM
jgi:hypothetical protein